MTGRSAAACGAWVVVKNMPPEAHCRTPSYLRGKTGRVVADLGCFRDPSLLAFHRPGLPMRRLFRVCFDQRALWDNYGPPGDKLFADLYEHWLEPAGDAAPDQEARPNA